MRRNNRKPGILGTILITMIVLAFLVYFFGALIFMTVGLAWLLVRFMIHHYFFVLVGIIVCLISWFCINCIKQISRKPATEEQAKRSAGHKIFLTLNCFFGAICIICVIGAALTTMSPPAKTASPQSTGAQATSEYMTEPRHGIRLNRTVYVSNSGHKIHLNSDCSGMKNYHEMTYEEACEAGYKHCSRCFN